MNVVESSGPAYPEIEPYESGHLKVSDLHSIYYEVCGCKTGIPIVFLHGGPGGSSRPKDRQLFDPKRFRIILLDQRACGKSLPLAELKDNNTWALLDDLEKLRKHLAIEKWAVFGGSWGSCLALIYAIAYPEKVLGLVVWGIYNATKEENDWVQQRGGASVVLSDAFDEYEKVIPPNERSNMVAAYTKRILSDDPQIALKYAKSWSSWEYQACKIVLPPEEPVTDPAEIESRNKWTMCCARIETHYFTHNAFLTNAFLPEKFQTSNEKSTNFFLNNIHILNNLPVPIRIIQGRLDLVCPFRTAWKLKQNLPKAHFQVVNEGVHSSSQLSMLTALVRNTDLLANEIEKNFYGDAK